MAKEIDLTSLKKRVTAQEPPRVVPPQPTRADPSSMRTAPPASQRGPAGPPIPLPEGRAIPAPAGGGLALTLEERRVLEEHGWQEGQPIPEGIQKVAAQIKQEADQPPDYSGVKPQIAETVNIEDLDSQEQARYRQMIDETLAAHQPAGSTEPPPPGTPPPPSSEAILGASPAEPMTMASQAVPGWKPPQGSAFHGVQPSMPNPQAQVTQGQPAAVAPPQAANQEEIAVEVDLPPRMDEVSQPTVTAAEQPPPLPPQAAPAEPEPEEESATGLGSPMTTCPQCEWPLDMPAIPEPEYGEKQAFLQSVLGQVPFTKQYDLLGGALTVVFRTLTIQEVDQIYKQAAYEFEKQPTWTRIDYFERVNRYRLYLQVVSLRSRDGKIAHEMPDGLSEEANPNASAYWKLPDPEDTRATAIPIIEEFFLKEVLRTEMLNRAIGTLCSKFNRLVAKLEAVIDNSDFWKRTGEQS